MINVVSTDGCWLWAGGYYKSGHGKIHLGWKNGKAIANTAHRLIYEALVGKVVKGYDVDHLCNNPPCINPEHLELVTHRENTLRYYRRKNLCRNGLHQMTEDNLYWKKKKSNINPHNPTGLARYCKACCKPTRDTKGNV